MDSASVIIILAILYLIVMFYMKCKSETFQQLRQGRVRGIRIPGGVRIPRSAVMPSDVNVTATPQRHGHVEQEPEPVLETQDVQEVQELPETQDVQEPDAQEQDLPEIQETSEAPEETPEESSDSEIVPTEESENKNNNNLGLIIGLGVGIPVVAIVIFALLAMSQNKKEQPENKPLM